MNDREDSRFNTHIKEPRWQIIASVVIVVAALLAEAFFLLR